MDDHAFHPAFVGASVNDEYNDDFDYLENEDNPDDNYWLSREQVDEFERPVGEYPEPSEWKADEDGNDHYGITVTVDKARRFLWKSAKTEIGIVRESWGDETDPSFDDLASKIFGPNSKLFHLLKEELGDTTMTYEVFCRFLATFYTGSMVSQPVPMLYDVNLFDTNGLMNSKEEYIRIYRQMETLGAGEDDDTLWMKVEDCFNNLMKKTFLSRRGNNDLSVALDDDKHHFNYSKNSDTYGLKRCRHVKDNRLGHTCHTAGLSGSGLPLCAMFQREGESTTDKYQVMMKKMFGSRSGNASPNLQGISLHSDRGYWTACLVFDTLLRWGADINGTVARTHWYPFTFSKKKQRAGDDEVEDPHGRKIIPMKGYKDVFYRTLDWNNSKLRATVYNSGTGTAVSLAMSSIHHYPAFDLNLAFPKDHKYYFDPLETDKSRQARAFATVAGSLDHLHCVLDLPILPLTCVQGDTSWFIMRKFSLTSSTVDPMISARAMEVTPSMDVRKAYEVVLGVVGRTDILPDEPLEEENNTPTAGTDDSLDDGDNSEDGDDASSWISRVNEENAAEEFLAALQGLDEGTLRLIVAKHKNSNPDAGISTIRKQLQRWANCESAEHRKYHWYNKTQLIDRLKAKDPRVKASISIKVKDFILDRLVTAEKQQQRRASLSRNGGQDPYAATPDEIDAVLLKGCMAWYMRKLKDSAKKYCREGHAMEIPFLKEFHEHSAAGITCGYKSIAIYETPLVESTVITGVLDSSDAELVYEKDDGSIGVLPVELKARLAHSTFYDERNRMECNLGFQAWENGEPIYVELDAESEAFYKWLPKHKESFQLLHHVAVRNLRKGLIIVGNRRKIMFGVFVNYTDETIAAYRMVLRDLYKRVLRPFYDDNLALNGKALDKVINSKEMEPIGLTPHSFQTSYFIWKRLRVDKCLPLPLPPCNRILPYAHSHWNNEKGASDTATKLFWNCRVMTANWGTSQTIALGKYFQLFAVVLHRWQQIATAKSDLNFYASLHHFRNSRNRHWPFRKVLDHLRKYLIRQADGAAAASLAAVASIPVAVVLTEDEESSIMSTPPRNRRDNPRNSFNETRNYVLTTGGTPGKGRQKFRKNSNNDPGWKADQERFHSCPGHIFKLSNEKKQKCFICNTKTTYVCLGCKRFYCFEKSRDGKLAEMIHGKKKEVEFLNGVRPPAQLDIAGYCSVVNSCYHIQHHESEKRRRPPLGTLSEN